MTNPNFEEMTTKELRTFVLEHREDEKAIAALADRVQETGVRLDSADQLPTVIRPSEEAERPE